MFVDTGASRWEESSRCDNCSQLKEKRLKETRREPTTRIRRKRVSGDVGEWVENETLK